MWLAVALFAAPAFSAVTVVSPASGALVTSPMTLIASATPCSSQPIAAMGYSLDSSTNTTAIYSTAVNTQVIAPLGRHTLHVKSWGNKGASCVADVVITVAAPAAAVPASSTTPVTNVVVSAPVNGATLTSPFGLSASGSQCSSQNISAFGYSLDNSANTTTAMAQSIAGQVTATPGAHVLHVKSWGNKGASCVTDLAITVTAPPVAPSGPTIPSNAVAIKAIQNLTTWKATFDAGTSGTASGSTNLVTAPVLSASSRQYSMSYTNYGGERFSANIGKDAAPTNFVFDTWLYIAGSIKDISNVELDMNQVMPNGQTVIFGFQCSYWSRTWDYTANTGSSPSSFKDQWLHSNQTCNPQTWTPNTWHHVQISYSRDSSGNVTYKSVWFDGAQQDLNVTVNSAFALGWGPAMVTNFQLGGINSTSGSATVYLDNFVVYSW